MIKLKRVYDKPEKGDGFRILVDRIWPRGMTKERTRVDLWLKDLGPSDKLRKWFAHDPSRWENFKERYSEELKVKKDLIKMILDKTKTGVVTLIYSAKDKEHNQAIAIKQFIDNHA